jgi:hypothetical protein
LPNPPFLHWDWVVIGSSGRLRDEGEQQAECPHRLKTGTRGTNSWEIGMNGWKIGMNASALAGSTDFVVAGGKSIPGEGEGARIQKVERGHSIF